MKSRTKILTGLVAVLVVVPALAACSAPTPAPTVIVTAAPVATTAAGIPTMNESQFITAMRANFPTWGSDRLTQTNLNATATAICSDFKDMIAVGTEPFAGEIEILKSTPGITDQQRIAWITASVQTWCRQYDGYLK